MTKTSKKHQPSQLSEISDALSAIGRRNQETHEEFQKQLGQPAFFLPDEDNGKGHGVGYWKGDGGVFSYRRYSNGYANTSRIDYPDALIDLLVKVRNGATQHWKEWKDVLPGAKGPEKKAKPAVKKSKKSPDPDLVGAEDAIHPGDLVYHKGAENMFPGWLYEVTGIDLTGHTFEPDDTMVLVLRYNKEGHRVVKASGITSVRAAWVKVPKDQIPDDWRDWKKFEAAKNKRKPKTKKSTDPEIWEGDTVALKADKNKNLWTVHRIRFKSDEPAPQDELHITRPSLVVARSPNAKDQVRIVEKKVRRKDCTWLQVRRKV